jgi:hypothetical protein
MAPRKSKNKSEEGEKSTSFAVDVSDGQESEEEQSAKRFKDPRSRPVSFAPRIKSRTRSVIRLDLREDPSFDARHILGPREDVDDVERRWQDEEGENCGKSFQLNQGQSPGHLGEQSTRVNILSQRSGGRESGAEGHRPPVRSCSPRLRGSSTTITGLWENSSRSLQCHPSTKNS